MMLTQLTRSGRIGGRVVIHELRMPVECGVSVAAERSLSGRCESGRVSAAATAADAAAVTETVAVTELVPHARPSGPPPASQRRAISVVVRGLIGRAATTLPARAAASFRMGRNSHSVFAVECPVPICAGGEALPGNLSCTNTDPARPGLRCFSCPVAGSGAINDSDCDVRRPSASICVICGQHCDGLRCHLCSSV